MPHAIKSDAGLHAYEEKGRFKNLHYALIGGESWRLKKWESLVVDLPTTWAASHPTAYVVSVL